MFFSKDEYQRRWRIVHAELRKRNYDVAVVWGRSGGTYERCGDVLYLTNFYSTVSGQSYARPHAYSAVLLSGSDEPELHIGEPGTDRDILATGRIKTHVDPFRSVADALVEMKVRGRVAWVGSDFLPVRYARQLEGWTPDVLWVPEDDLVQLARRIKSPQELDCFRLAGETATAGLNALMEGLIHGRTEAEAAAAAAFEIVKRGGNFHMIPCNHGDRLRYWCRSPLTGYSQDAPKQGDLVRGWVYGPMREGYWLDPGRTAVAGRKPKAAQRNLIERAVGAVDGLIQAIRPGVSVADVVAVGDRLTYSETGEKDQAAKMFPLYGHGIGLFFEFPYISTDGVYPGQATQRFEENMVLGVEVFMAEAGVGSVGFEQNIIVHRDDNEIITKSPMTWW